MTVPAGCSMKSVTLVTVSCGSVPVHVALGQPAADPDTVGSGPVHSRFDLPGGAARLYAEALGVHHVLVNGVEVAADGELSGEHSGTVLRSGRDTETTAVGAAT